MPQMLLLLACTGSDDATQIAPPLGGCDVQAPVTLETTEIDLAAELTARGVGGIAQTESGAPLVHVTDVDRHGDVAWLRGYGGVFRVDRDGAVDLYSGHPFEADLGAALDADRVVAWQWNLLFALQADGSALTETARISLDEPSALDGDGDRVVYGTADGVVQVLDASTLEPMDAIELDRGVTFLRVTPDHLFAGLGDRLVELDPDTLEVRAQLALPAPVRDVRAVGDDRVVALGSRGVERLDASGQVVWATSGQGTAVGLDVTDKTAWVATFEGVAQLDLDSGELLGSAATEEFSYGVAAWDDHALVGAFSHLVVVDRVVDGPQALAAVDLSQVVVTSGEVRWPVLENVGDAPLTLVGGEGLTLDEEQVLVPGAALDIALTDDAIADGRACLATDSGGRVDLDVRVANDGESLAALGVQAVDFELPSTAGGTRRLSDAEGPVVIAFFNSYCPVCPVELIDLQENVLAAHPQAELWAISSEESLEQAAAFAGSLGFEGTVLVDESGEVHATYAQQAAFEQVLFPQEWVVDASGTIVYASNVYDPDALHAILE